MPVRRSVTFPDMVDPERELPELAVNEFKRWSGTLPAGGSAVFLEPLNRYEATLLRRVEQAADLAGRIGSPRVRSLADMFHMNIEEADMAKPILAAASQLAYVHTADNNRLQPGAGCMDFSPTFRALKEIGYAGYVSIECTDWEVHSVGRSRLNASRYGRVPAREMGISLTRLRLTIIAGGTMMSSRAARARMGHASWSLAFRASQCISQSSPSSRRATLSASGNAKPAAPHDRQKACSVP